MDQIQIKPLEILISFSIILSPLYVVRLTLYGLPTTLLEIILLTMFAVWFWQRGSIIPSVSFLIRAPARIKVLERSERFLLWPIVILVLGVVIAAIISPDQRGALGILKAYFLEPILFFYLLIDSRLLQKGSDPFSGSDPMLDRRRTIVSSLIITGLYLSIWGIAQVVLGFGVIAPHEQLAGRAHGPFNSGNALALFLGPVFLLVLGQTLQTLKTSGLKRLVYGLISLIILSALILTKSKGGVIGVFIAISVIGLIYFLRRCNKIFLLSKIWLVIPIYLIIVTGGLTQISRFTPKNNNPWLRPLNDTLTPRLCLWEGAVNLLKDRPLLGAGLNGFKSLYSQKYFTCDAEALQYPHNFILNFGTETGILGVLGIFGILAVFLRQQSLVLIKIAHPRKMFLVYSLIAIVFYWLIHGLVDVPYFKNDLSLQFWIIMALGFLTNSTSTETV